MGNEELKLTDKEELYCQNYVVCMNQSTAYRLAFEADAMNSNSVAVEACRLHSNPNITLRIKDIQKEAYERNKATIDELVNTLSNMVRFDIAELYDDNGNLLPIKEMPLIARQMISEIASDHIRMGGEVVGETKKVKTIAKLDAVEKLMKHLGGYEKDNGQKNKTILDYSTLSTDELQKRAEAISKINGKA